MMGLTMWVAKKSNVGRSLSWFCKENVNEEVNK